MTEQPKPETMRRWVGRRYGRLVVVAFDHFTANTNSCWRCQCDCGRQSVVTNSNLLTGRARSCGCYKKEQTARNKPGMKHGLSRTSEYGSWYRLIRNWDWEVCDRWLDFEDFYADMGERPPGRFLVRLDTRKLYEPGNCVWGSKLEVARQSAHGVWLDFQGRRQTMGAWADELGMSRQLLSLRLKSGWSVEKALSTPVKRPRGAEA